jgi:hypothetical protein
MITMRTTTARIALAAAAVLTAALAACSSDEGRPAAAAPAHTATPSATPTTPAPPTRAQAAQIYLQAVTPANAAGKAVGDAMDAKKGTGTIRAKAKVAARTNRAFLDVLLATQWPKNVQRHIDEVAKSTAVQQTMYEGVAQAKSRAEAEEIVDSTLLDNSAAQLVRARLGLPPAK